jgi:hypothetical protein
MKLTSLLSRPLPHGHTRHMNPSPATNLYKRHRFPAEIIGHCVWLYFRCAPRGAMM